MKNYFKNKMNHIKKEKERIEKMELNLKQDQERWEFFNSNKSKKHIHFPTFNDLIDYDHEIFDEDEKIISGYENIDYDLAYFKMVLNEICEYDFLIPFKFSKRKIKPKDLIGLEISDTYIEYIKTIINRLEKSKSEKDLN